METVYFKICFLCSKPKRGANDLPQKLESLYDRIRDFTDARGRTISTPFMKIPSRAVSIKFYYMRVIS